jgi:hypothetical protein
MADFAALLRESPDRLELDWTVLSDAPAYHSTRGIYVTGLQLCGAAWDARHSTLAQPRRGEAPAPLPGAVGKVFPAMLLQPWARTEASAAAGRGGSAGAGGRAAGGAAASTLVQRVKYRCPVYAHRGMPGGGSRLLDVVELPSDQPLRIWQRQGVHLALLRRWLAPAVTPSP